MHYLLIDVDVEQGVCLCFGDLMIIRLDGWMDGVLGCGWDRLYLYIYMLDRA